MIKGLIFDLDGVLVDTAKHHFTAWQRTAESLGITFSEKENENLKGVSRMESLDYILSLGNKTLSYEDKVKYAYQKNEWYLELISDLTDADLLPGALKLLQIAKDQGIKISLGSASKNAVVILKATNIYSFFQSIIDGTKTTESKPHPQVFQMAALEMGLNPEQCIVFEDSLKGIEAANSGGFPVVGIGKKGTLRNTILTIENLSEFNLKYYLNLSPTLKA